MGMYSFLRTQTSDTFTLCSFFVFVTAVSIDDSFTRTCETGIGWLHSLEFHIELLCTKLPSLAGQHGGRIGLGRILSDTIFTHIWPRVSIRSVDCYELARKPEYLRGFTGSELLKSWGEDTKLSFWNLLVPNSLFPLKSNTGRNGVACTDVKMNARLAVCFAQIPEMTW